MRKFSQFKITKIVTYGQCNEKESCFIERNFISTAFWKPFSFCKATALTMPSLRSEELIHVPVANNLIQQSFYLILYED